MSDVVVTFNEFAKAGAEEGLKASIVVTLIRVRDNALTLAPEDLGYLKNGIMWRKGWGNDAFSFPKEGGFNEAGGDAKAVMKIEDTSGIEGVVGNAAEYAIYQEFGTKFMPAQPHMRPAADAVRGSSAEAIAKKWGNDAMDREFRKRKTTRTTR